MQVEASNVKIADLKAHNASRCEALWAFRSAIFTLLASFLLNICQFGIKKGTEWHITCQAKVQGIICEKVK